MDFSMLDAEQTLIITASRRQSRFLREQYAHYQLEQEKDVWHSLKAMPWSAFINHCWEMALDAGKPLPIRLSQTQSQHIWQTMVAKSDITQTLLNAKQTQKLSHDAWRLCQQWQIETLDYLPGDQDQVAFETWFKEYQKLLSQKDWVDSYQQPNHLLDVFSAIVDQLPDTIITYGFQQPTPQQSSLFERLQQHKNVTSWQLLEAQAPRQLNIHALPDPKTEILAAVRWAKDKLKQNEQTDIAIVVPELDKWRPYIERVIQREFYAKSLADGEDSHQQLHDFSIDESLSQQPLVAVVIDWLRLTCGSLSKQQLQHLLLSPYLYSEREDHWQATQLELYVRQSTKSYYTLDELLKMSRRLKIQLSWLGAAEQWQQVEHKRQDLKSHISDVLRLLEELHWTGYRSLSSREYQVQQTFVEAIKSAQSLQRVLAESMTYPFACNILFECLDQQSFHQQRPRAPLQIVGMLEAIGLRFSAVWLVGATDQVLPQKAVPNPFLSKALHAQYDLPGSSHLREVEYAKSVLDSLLPNKDVVVSYAEFDGEQEQMISPLLQSLTERHPIEKLDLESDLPQWLAGWSDIKHLEYYEDSRGLPIAQNFEVRGGTGLLRMQAASPFDAYLKYRLQLEPFEVDGLGVSFMDRGNMFHKAMQLIWQRLENQANLLALSADAQEELICKTLDFVLSEASREVYLLNNASFREIEKHRLKALVVESLELDKQRDSFKVIATEAAKTLELAGLQFSMIIDRIDQLDDGSLLIIDYKTGQPSLMSLFREPIAEPQLLLYAIAEHKLEQPVAGIVFMQAHLKASKYIGVTDEPEVLEGVKALRDIKYNPYADNFEHAIQQWKQMLEKIAQDFKSGKANLSEYSGDFVDYTSISRWSQRDLNVQALIEGEEHE
ncbi:PD-(D/E)XK nuclease family protein [Kangiella marina]|uniref:PD-(D/E)XK nuclease family protein n=1 Tax=Kangiella marina TaxID=1079178 RepID=A0ABP8IN45_9GAMM